MKTIELSAKQPPEIQDRRRQAGDRRIFQRLSALLGIDEGRTREEVAELLGISSRQVGDWLRIFRGKGLDELCTLHYSGRSRSVINPATILLLVTLFGEGSGCPCESGGGSAILTGSAIIPRGHPQGGRHAGRRALVPARSGTEDDLHPLLSGAIRADRR